MDDLFVRIYDPSLNQPDDEPSEPAKPVQPAPPRAIDWCLIVLAGLFSGCVGAAVVLCLHWAFR